MSDTQTDIETRAKILGQFFIEFKGISQFEDFFQYNDLGLPLSYIIDSGITPRTSKSDEIINETWELLLDALDAGEDTGFESIDDLIVL